MNADPLAMEGDALLAALRASVERETGRKLITRPGVYDVAAADYHADQMTPQWALSSSGARKIISTCAAQFHWDHEHPTPSTEALDVGAAAHEWLLEGETWPHRFTVLPDDHDGRSKAGKERVAQIAATGKRPLKADDFATIKAMHDALAAHPFAMAAFRNVKTEQSLYWRDERFGIWCRARLDAMPVKGSIFADYKTCRSADPEHIRKAVADYGYHMQSAWYCDGIRALGICPKPTFMFIFQAKQPPYLVTPVVLDEATIEWGEALNRKAKAVFAHGIQTGEWGAYTDDIMTLGLPHWEARRLENMAELGQLAADMQAPNYGHAA